MGKRARSSVEIMSTLPFGVRRPQWPMWLAMSLMLLLPTAVLLVSGKSEDDKCLVQLSACNQTCFDRWSNRMKLLTLEEQRASASTKQAFMLKCDVDCKSSYTYCSKKTSLVVLGVGCIASCALCVCCLGALFKTSRKAELIKQIKEQEEDLENKPEEKRASRKSMSAIPMTPQTATDVKATAGIPEPAALIESPGEAAEPEPTSPASGIEKYLKEALVKVEPVKKLLNTAVDNLKVKRDELIVVRDGLIRQVNTWRGTRPAVEVPRATVVCPSCRESFESQRAQLNIDKRMVEPVFCPYCEYMVHGIY